MVDQGAAPGWYEDPLDAANVRYWNGRAWTGHVTVLEHPSALARLTRPVDPSGEEWPSSRSEAADPVSSSDRG